MKINIFYSIFFFINLNIVCIGCNSCTGCKSNKNKNSKNIKNNKENNEKDKEKIDAPILKKDDKKDIIEKNAFSRWFRNNCGIQSLIIFLFYLFKDNTEILNKFKNSNIDFYTKLPMIFEKFNDFLNNNEKTIFENDFVDFYIDILNFFKFKIIDITNKINEYIKNHPEIIDEDGFNKDDEKFQSLHDIRLYYSGILDDLIVINENKNFFNSLINKYNLGGLCPISCLHGDLQSYFKNKECWFKYNDVINEIFQIIENNKYKLDLYSKVNYADFLKTVFEDFIKISESDNKIYKYNIEDKTTTIEYVGDSEIENLTNNNFIKSELIKTNFENVYLICLNCTLGGEYVDHAAFIYKDNNCDWWLNGGYNKIIKVDPELIKQQNFKQIMDNYSHIMNYKFVGIRYVLCKNIN